LDSFDTVFAKKHATSILQQELSSKKKKGLILTGSMGDPYNPFEATEHLTRDMLHLIDRYGFGITLLTKSSLVTRDIDLFEKIQTHLPCAVSITITTADDTISKRIEPGVSLSSERFTALKELSAHNILSGVTLMPTLPFITDTKENISAIISQAKASGASWVYAEKMLAVSLRDRQRDYFYQQLDERFPGIKMQYEKAFGDQYWCETPNKTLWDHFVHECDAHGIIYSMHEIERLIRKRNDVQMSLFES
jgi:DNA repair photolyase